MSDHGYLPLGKFSRARDSILHFMCISEWDNGDSFGDMEWGAYHWKVSNEAAEVSMENEEFNSLMAEWLEFNPEVTDSAELRAELVGHFIVTETTTGFVAAVLYDDEQDRDNALLEASNHYDRWHEDEPTMGDYFS
ncbi:hypothetical protein PBI_MIMI_303 [Arthrobacter phage Mimi]|nr:hypothetical protein PBI_MIMI_97 [Arthrobacter phage Mimi]